MFLGKRPYKEKRSATCVPREGWKGCDCKEQCVTEWSTEAQRSPAQPDPLPIGLGARPNGQKKRTGFVLQAWKVTDPNGNRAVFGFSPLGLLKQSGVIGKYGANEGDIITESPLEYKPSVLMEYDFFAFINDADPVWVKTIQREQHYRNADHSINPNSPEIIKVEYTDGFGRLLQTRTQAEDVIFGDPLFGDSGLPEQQGQNGNAVGVQRGALDPLNVVVSGWKIYNNKGKVVEQYEPFFDKGFDYSPPFSLSTPLGGVQSGAKIKMYYDPRGNVIRTVNPDNSEQWVVYGKPTTLSSIAINNSWSFKNYAPTPWESYTYDANDNAGRTNTGNNQVPITHYNTPSSSVLDALGRVVKATNRLDNNSQEVTVRNTYDIQGNLTKVIDPKGRPAFVYTYDLQNQNLQANQIDSGNKWNIADAAGKPIQSNDEKGAQVLTNYDTISRPVIAYAKDNSAGSFRFSQVSFYGDATGIADNLNGKLHKHYDEAGVSVITHYDFKGNVTHKYRQVIKDSEILSVFNSPPPDWDIAPYRTDWNPNGGNFDTHANSLLDSKHYETDTEYDALNRATKIKLPEDIYNDRKDIEPAYNNAGALEKITYDGTEYVKQIAYNAKGQQLLVAWNNDVMIRFAYDKKTFRLKRVKAEKYTYSQSGNTHTYAYNSGTTRYDQAYLYDLVGNVTAVSDKTPDCGLPSANDSLQRLFEYDAIYRLIYANGREQDNVTPSDLWQNPPQAGTPNANNCRGYDENYEYDLAGNLLNVIHTAQSNNWTRHYNYSGNTNKHSSIDDGQGSPTTLASYTYDNAGNQTNCNADRKYIWGATNQLVAFIRQAGTSEPSVYAQYLYDATGNRVKKVVRKQGGQVETVTYIDGIFEYHTKVTTSTSEEKNYTLIQGEIEVRTGSFSGDGSEELIYTISDYLSSAVIRLTDNGSILDKEEYYPYGDTSLRTFGKKRYRFTGKERDDESGLYYYGARYYEAWSGKFLSIDPMIAKTPALSPYCYANGNPLVFNDPSGMEGEQQTSGGGSIIRLGRHHLGLMQRNATNIVGKSGMMKVDFIIMERDIIMLGVVGL